MEEAGGDADAGAGDPVVEVSLLYSVACAVTASGKLYCWGGASTCAGQMGTGELVGADGGSSIVLAPRKLPLTARDIAVGATHTCAKGSTDTLKCWGSNTSGELGHTPGTQGDVAANGLLITTGNPTPHDGPNVSGFGAASLGFQFGCAIGAPSPTNSVGCRGYDNLEQLGYALDGSLYNPFAQYASYGNEVIKTISAGFAHACVLDTAGAAYCWGRPKVGSSGRRFLSRALGSRPR